MQRLNARQKNVKRHTLQTHIYIYYCLSKDTTSRTKFLMTSCPTILTKQGLKHQYVTTLFVMQECFPSTPMFVEKLN